MKTKNSKLFGLFCLLMLSVVGVQAQTWKYPRVENGNTIVSRGAVGGIKIDALLTADHKNFLTNRNTIPIYNELDEQNKVSAKFQVALTNPSPQTSWAFTNDDCKGYSVGAPAGSWRAPTQRELMLIWMFKSQLNATPGFTALPASGGLWSGTGFSRDNTLAWYVNFSDGTPSFGDTDIYPSYGVRCVRDL